MFNMGQRSGFSAQISTCAVKPELFSFMLCHIKSFVSYADLNMLLVVIDVQVMQVGNVC